MLRYNVYYLTKDRSTQAWMPHFTEMGAEEPVINGTTNSDAGFKDDPTITQFRNELEKEWQTTVVVQAVVEL